MKPGRNDLCPCGSGKKYKKCCGASSSPVPIRVTKERDYVTLNRAIAYKGKIGRMRAEFCRHYIAHKQTVFKEIEKDLSDQTAVRREKITCHKGCFYCCSQYIAGTLQESEAIVYYLYQHEVALTNFIRAYPIWREKVRVNESLFKSIRDILNKGSAEGFTEKNRQAYQEATVLYLAQNIPCPFLSNGICSIYEVRPWPCAGVVATTPGEWCSPLTNDKPSVYISRLTPKEVPYFRETKALIMFPVPLGVYEILNGGFIWLSDIPDLEGLDNETMTDPEVRPILQRYL
jgi:Fe-S-cluster containining protein